MKKAAPLTKNGQNNQRVHNNTTAQTRRSLARCWWAFRRLRRALGVQS